MRFCLECGSDDVQYRIPVSDNLPRHVCSKCGYIHYVNPKVVAGCLSVWEDKILMCKRAIEPQCGLWTLPAGFLEVNETLGEGASREAWEEANAKVEINQLYAVYSVPHISQIHAMFLARLTDAKVAPGEESLEVALCGEAEIPWDAIAFPTTRKTLELYFQDRREGRMRMHTAEIQHTAGPIFDANFTVTSV